MKPSTAESLKEYFSSGVNKKKWEEAKAKAKEASSFAEYDDGKYTAQVIGIKINRSESSNRLQAVMTFRFVGGNYASKNFYKYHGIEDGIEYLLRDLKTLGYEDVDLDSIEDDVFPEIKKNKPTVKVKLTTKGEFQNIYIQGLEEGSAEEEDDEDEDVKPEKPDADEDEDEDKKVSAEEEDDDDEDEDDDDDEDKDDEEKVVLEIGMKLKVKNGKEEVKAKIVKIDDPGSRVKVKLPNGEKIWVDQDKIVDVVEG